MMVSLRPESPEDWHWLWHWPHELDDPEWKRLDSPFLHEQSHRLSFEQFTHDRPLTPRLGAVIDVDDRPVGYVNRGELARRGGGWWDWGIVIYDPSDRRKGIGETAARMWIDDTFESTNAHLLTLTTWSGNKVMQGLGEKLGVTECSRIPQVRLWEGRRYDAVQMALLRSDWEVAPPLSQSRA